MVNKKPQNVQNIQQTPQDYYSQKYPEYKKYIPKTVGGQPYMPLAHAPKSLPKSNMIAIILMVIVVISLSSAMYLYLKKPAEVVVPVPTEIPEIIEKVPEIREVKPVPAIEKPLIEKPEIIEEEIEKELIEKKEEMTVYSETEPTTEEEIFYTYEPVEERLMLDILEHINDYIQEQAKSRDKIKNLFGIEIENETAEVNVTAIGQTAIPRYVFLSQIKLKNNKFSYIKSEFFIEKEPVDLIISVKDGDKYFSKSIEVYNNPPQTKQTEI